MIALRSCLEKYRPFSSPLPAHNLFSFFLTSPSSIKSYPICSSCIKQFPYTILQRNTSTTKKSPPKPQPTQSKSNKNKPTKKTPTNTPPTKQKTTPEIKTKTKSKSSPKAKSTTETKPTKTNNSKEKPIKSKTKTKSKPATNKNNNNAKKDKPPPIQQPQPPPPQQQNKTTDNIRVSDATVTVSTTGDIYPIIALIGRPNVGKSTLFNRFALGDKRALIANVAGTTRDRDYASCRWYGRDLIVVDTGGIVGEGGENKKDSLAALVREQAIIAIQEASTIVFVLDLNDGVTPHDFIIARLLRARASGKHVVVVVNKGDNTVARDEYFEEHKMEYIRLGFGEPFVASAIHGDGFIDIMRKVVDPYPETPEEDTKSKEIRIAIVGQPNAGKSSLLNRITGQQRSVVSPIAGTTADPVDTLITWRGTHRVRLIDTAGIWRKAKDHLARAAVIWALRVVQRAHVVILVIDGTVGVTEHDMHVAGFILEHMKSVVVAVNKWDILPKIMRERDGDKPKRDKMSHYEWQLHAKDLAEKVMAKDKLAVMAWEKGIKEKKGKKWEAASKEPKQEETPKVRQLEEEGEEEETNLATEVKVNMKEGKDITVNEVTKEILDAEEVREKKGKGAKSNATVEEGEINFEELEREATEFDISLEPESKEESQTTEEEEGESENKKKEGEAIRKKKHKPTQEEEAYETAARTQLRFMPFVPFTFISATTGYRVPSLMDQAVGVFHERGKRIKTQDMFEVLRTAALRHKLPGKGKNLLRVRFATQIDAYPPTFVFFVNNPDVVQQHYEKFLEACIREKYQFSGTPIRLLFKKNSNKYVDQKSKSK